MIDIISVLWHNIKRLIMWRLFFIILCIIIDNIFGLHRVRYGRIYQRGRRRRYGFYDDDLNYYDNRYNLADIIKVNLRRRKALKSCKNFLTRKKSSYTLKNSNVILSADTKNKTIVCLNAKNIKQSISVMWAAQPEYNPVENLDNTFEQVFDGIFTSFDNNASYDGILKVLKANFSVIQETKEDLTSSNLVKEESIDTPDFANRLNINSATEEELAQMPGINIVLAKKIVNRVNSKGNYYSLDEMFREMKIKQHFQDKLKKMICAKPAEHKIQIKNNNDRIIDI